MTDENRAKIREALTWMANEALDALALLDAEDTPSVLGGQFTCGECNDARQTCIL